MRRTLLLAAAIVLPLCCVLPAAGQAPGGAQQDTPETLKAAYDQAVKAKDYAGALADAQKLVDLSPTAENLRLLGNAQSSSGAPQDALATYDKALAAAETEKPAEGQPDAAWKDEKAKILLWKGNAYLRLKRNDDAIALYNQAAALAADPSIPTFDICVVFYNIGDTQNALSACRKAVAVAPTNANAWFVLASLLYATAQVDSKGNMIISDETRQALNKYLELAPDGPHAADVKAMLDMAVKP